MPFRIIALAGFVAAVLGAGSPAAAQDILDRAREAVREAGEKVEEAARQAGRNVSDFLVDNPDLNRDLVDLGKRLGLPGFDEAGPERGPGLVAAPSPTAPGATVQLAAVGLPGSTSVVIAAGPSVAAAVAVAKAATNAAGRMQATVTVPQTAPAGSTIVFVIETADGRVRLVSEPMEVVAAEAVVTVVGTLSNEGVECPALRGDDGALYTLATTDIGAFGPGDRVRVEGTVAEISICNQGTTLAVITVSAAE